MSSDVKSLSEKKLVKLSDKYRAIKKLQYFPQKWQWSKSVEKHSNKVPQYYA